MTTFATRFIAFALAAIALSHSASAQPVHRAAPRAVTLWWVIFNKPANCTAAPGAEVQCGSVDVFGAPFLASVANGSPDPSLIAPNTEAELAVVYGTGGVTSQSGELRLAASIYKGEANAPMTLSPGTDPMGLGRGLENREAEVHLVLRDHGPANYRDLLPQITNFLDPYCSDPNLLYFAGKNTCADVQFAVYAPTATGEAPVLPFADPTNPVRGAKANLFRDGDVIRAVVHSRVKAAD